jgi:3-oxoacyl-[acyl-carrier protein] reductase
MHAVVESRQLEHGVALVTGAGSGIGRGIALALGSAGYRVAVNHLDTPDAANETVRQVIALGADATAVQGDVRIAADVDRMVAAVTTHFGALTLMVNNAGVQTQKPLLDLDEADWDRVIDTNLKGCFLCTRAAGRYMRDHGGGNIVNIGSGSNKTAFPQLAAYTASKGGIEMFTKVAAAELGPHGIRVNCIAPGAIEVERTKQEHPNYARTFSRYTPLGRIGTPEDIGRAVAMVASPDAAFITGQTIYVDGGLFGQPSWTVR